MTGDDAGSRLGTLHREGAAIAWEEFGATADPLLMLVCGAATSRDWWDREFCELLVAGRASAGGRLRVIRYDLRDAGESTTGRPGEPEYTGADLVGDLAALIRDRADGAAHVVGLSFGGGLAQQLALAHPELVATLTLMSTSPAGPGAGRGELPPPTPALVATFSREPEPPVWGDAESVARWLIETERPFGGTIPLDERRIRRIAAEIVARAGDQSASGNHVLAEAGPGVRDDVASISAPTLVLHGSEDPLFPLAHGERLAELIPGARLVVIPGHGHQYPPPPTWGVVVPAILEHVAGRAGGSAAGGSPAGGVERSSPPGNTPYRNRC